MKRKHVSLTLSVLGLVLVGWTCFGQDQDKPSTGKRVSERIDSAVQSLKRGAKEATESLQQQYARARVAIHNMGVSGRVYGRLHWDKALQSSKIEIDVKEDGVATLRGTASDARAKAKAVELTRDTVGVTQVIDQMAMPASETSAPATTTPSQP